MVSDSFGDDGEVEAEQRERKQRSDTNRRGADDVYMLLQTQWTHLSLADTYWPVNTPFTSRHILTGQHTFH